MLFLIFVAKIILVRKRAEIVLPNKGARAGGKLHIYCSNGCVCASTQLTNLADMEVMEVFNQRI